MARAGAQTRPRRVASIFLHWLGELFHLVAFSGLAGFRWTYASSRLGATDGISAEDHSTF